MQDIFHLAGGAPRLLHGADYNPEQWQFDEAILEEDFARMREAGVTSLSIGIFSWTLYEPEEGRYEFEWMDRLMDRLAAEGIVAFLATPSASKPMWMSERYPEIRRVARDGLRERSGFRHNHCPSSTLYREKVAALNSRLAERYKGHPALGLWHLGNELQGECFCDHCLNRFREWLEQRYGTLSALHDAWWARFWNHTFTDWQQIDPRDESIDGMQVDWKRFMNVLHVEFLENEIAPLRTHTPDVPVTTNYMRFHPDLDYWRWSKVLDLISNDSYPSYDGGEDMWQQAAATSLIHDLMRGLADGKSWILMESSPSSVNWKEINKLKPAGVHLAESAQVVAHGGDAVHYFQFRKGRGGMEKFHGAIVDHDSGTDTRIFREVAEVGAWLQDQASVVGTVCPRAEVALLHDWESQWALNSSFGIRQPIVTGIEPRDAYHDMLHQHHRGWWESSVATDVIWPDADDFREQLVGRKVVVASSLYMLKPKVAAALIEWAQDGGCLILSHHSGVVDSSNRVHLGGLPGLGIHEAAGAKVEEVDALFQGEMRAIHPTGLLDGLGGDYQVSRAFGLLQLKGASSIVDLTEGLWAGRSIASHGSCGRGEIIILAANFCDDFHRDFSRSVVGRLNLTQAIAEELPRGVHASVREDESRRHLFVINYSSESVSLDLPEGWEQGDAPAGRIELPSFGVRVFGQAKSDAVCCEPEVQASLS
ncbi:MULTISPECIES: beta-galactosidase [unclassified Lentimonas]|uniref:beta-galactosidase n=1 Tax=unclassified Lentimonas TaxID=2630993 RepID=UPI0013216EB2|nr:MULTISPECIES: beta-galactosidase [unclassified Lentimonas]CAA6679353.1 Beta-galactosidase (EC [Lentimonas sp. CC4]CAA6687368.1 Beta-galactosidase (EC [Lentimonas sp. CC6]CAA7078041.1 Beta-galactosidase (EC [Lentimonas sp. CC4]CAA7168010.1 Beta-galactosidase (EC [Lentimonas sp. CC21]CAA7179585.1 Beta-galactosidase (EC [Lentimonas sp. CC8]